MFLFGGYSMRHIMVMTFLVVCSATAEMRAETDLEDIKFFDTSVRPLLAEKCFKCHGPKKQKGSLRLDARNTMLVGGDIGPAVVPGKPDESLIIEAISYKDEDLQMPPKRRLTDQQVAILKQWIAIGAPFPGGDVKIPVKGEKITDEDRKYWAFQPVAEPVPPQVDHDGWSQSPIDRFIFRKLVEKNLRPAKPASRRELIRRAYFDLIGLPPTPDAVEAFVNDTSANAFEKVIDLLLTDKRYGERWGRHWLDLVRYADSDGYRQDAYRPNAWRYRDYVIRSFNADKPYDRFVREQLAGDEIASDDPDALIATGFMRLGIYEYNQRDAYAQLNFILDDIAIVTSDVFLGMSMGCAQCHDHKFDPILREDYFRLRAFFEAVIWRDEVVATTKQQRSDYEAKLAAWEQQTADIRRQIDELAAPANKKATQSAVSPFTPALQAVWNKPADQRTPYEQQLHYLIWRQVEDKLSKAKPSGDSKKKWDKLNNELKKYEKLKPPALPSAMVATDLGPVAPPTRIPKDRRKRNIDPGYITVIAPGPASIKKVETAKNSTGRRTALANWITRPDNPLTARVMVNRIWHYHFGRGIVATTSEFGKMGEQPTHPQLLDWLASQFVENGYSIKQMHRLIMTSSTYRQTSRVAPTHTAKMTDPFNRFLWRFHHRRLDAEQVRDALLAVSGDLSDRAGGASSTTTSTRRSVYTKVMRLTPDLLLNAFDVADGLNSMPARSTTTTATQALLLINGDWVYDRAKALAARVQKAPGASNDPAKQIDVAYQLVYSRQPTAEERSLALEFLTASPAHPSKTKRSAQFAIKTFPNGGQAINVRNGALSDRFHVDDNASLPSENFTVEVIGQLNSLYPDASVRVVASQWTGNTKSPGWSFGVTSKKSRYQPRNLILQLIGQTGDKKSTYEVIASNLRAPLNKPLYLAVSVNVADTSEKGITFYMKDLSSPEAPIQSARMPHKVIKDYKPNAPFTIGGRSAGNNHGWDGLIDEVRISNAALTREQLLTNDRSPRKTTVGHWRFESPSGGGTGGGITEDESGKNNHLTRIADKITKTSRQSQALIDFCHALLNSNEFLYVE